jgi:hypothetical protein
MSEGFRVQQGRPGATELLLSVAEQLKMPLTNIARLAELAKMDTTSPLDLNSLSVHAQVALTLVDSYLLGLQLAQEQGSLALEPVSVSSILNDTAHQLQAYAKQHNVMLEVRIAGRYGPVMAHFKGLQAALLSLGYTLVESQAAQPGRRELVLAAHRTPHGIVAGLYGEHEALSAPQWRRALELCGRARQPFTALSASSAAGLFVADTIFQAMASRLRVGRHNNQTGLAATLLPSQQLQLV